MIMKNLFKIILGIIISILLFCSFFFIMGAIAVLLLELGVKRFLFISGLGFIILIIIIVKCIKSRS